MDRIVHNIEISRLFETLADLLEIDGANRFRVRAYRNAARVISNLPREAASMVVEGEDLTTLPGIGEDLAGKIAEICKTGHLSVLDETAKHVPPGLAEIVALPNVGPKRAKLLHDALGVKGAKDLAAKIRSGAAGEIPGLGAVTLSRILKAIEKHETEGRRFKLADAEAISGPLRRFLSQQPGVEHVVIAGSLRRRRETVGDIDILATGDSRQAANVMNAFTTYPEVARVVASGKTRATVVLESGLQVDLRFVATRSFGAALHYFTGSKEHNIALRALAVKAGLKLNEYGLFRGNTAIAGKSEEEVYTSLGMDFIPPELRENRGEIEAALTGKLPRLIELKDMRGDLHTHTSASDGTLTIAEMAAAAEVLGYEYIAITDHSKRVSVAHGLDERRLNEQMDEIDRLAPRFKGIKILKSCEVDIRSNGSLDLENDTLRRLDFVYGAVHYNFELSRERQTERIIRAMDNPYFTILAHPTGRIINRREPYEVDMERLLRAAAERHCLVEINAHPDRLDLNDIHCRMAKEMGVKIVISTDAHSAEGLHMMRYGIDQARRGWLTAADVANTSSWSALKALLGRR